jgi:hypothetical protein
LPHQLPLRAGDPRRVGRYRLTGRLTGITSDDPIYLGTGPDGTGVAISMLGGEWAGDAAARDRFAAEAAVAKRVPPFCAARVLDAGVDGDEAYLVSEYVPGQSLLELVQDAGVRAGADLQAIAIGMATGLASVHQAGLVHGHFGPEYVILPADGPLRVIEFGITPPYGAATPSADMLAWGQTVMFAAVGHPAASMTDLDVLPDLLRDPVERSLDPDPSERPAARAVVLSLLGDDEIPAGLLAEGSRRATWTTAGGGRGAGQGQVTVIPRHSAVGRPSGARPPGTPVRPAGRPPAGSRHAHNGTAPPQGRPSGRPAGPSPGGSRRRTAWITGSAVAVLIVVAVIAMIHVLQSSGHPSNAACHQSVDTGASGHASASASPSLSPNPGPVTPAAFAGSWSGLVRQPQTKSYSVTVILKAGTGAGTISYSGSDFSCAGSLSLTRETTAKLTMSQDITQGQCMAGQITLTLTSGSSVSFDFSNSGPVAATGTLTKS